MQLTDTHCHIHEIVDNHKHADEGVHEKWRKAGLTDPDAVIADAHRAGVTRLICVGCTVEDSALAVDFVQQRANTWASIGIHPHEAARYIRDTKALETFAALASKPKVVAVGECGLDYYYHHSPKEDQEKMLRFQMELALKHDLPMAFHVRDAFTDFWPIFDDYPGIRGVVHSFTASRHQLDEALARGLYVGLNGIVTFTKAGEQLETVKAVPLKRMLLETDAPFLTPVPHRGKICVPGHVVLTAEFLSNLRDESLDEIASVTTRNARDLFGLR